jgi:uncharacterized protein GlcG (DUF336 family)
MLSDKAETANEARLTSRRGHAAIIGTIGCSGGADSQDEIVSQTGAAVINEGLTTNK